MASKSAANQMAQYVKTMRLAACRRVLAKGREMQASGRWISPGGDDVFACWQQSLNSDEKLPETYDLDVTYADTGSKEDIMGQVVMSHGTPGSHNDFKYVVPTLVEKKVRVLVPNFPGHGLTNSPPAYRQSNDERVEFLVDFAKEAGLQRIDIMVGHSAGCYPLFKLGGDEQYWTPDGPVCRSLLLLNPVGTLYPHKYWRYWGYVPYWVPRLLAKLQYTRCRGIVGWLQYMIWIYILRLKVASAELAMAGTDMIANAGLSQGPRIVRRLGSDPKSPRVLVLYAEDDPLTEKERGEETASALGIDLPNIFKVRNPEDIEAALNFVRAWWTSNNGAKNAVIAFGKGLAGHYLQKHQAAFTVSCIEIMLTKMECDGSKRDVGSDRVRG